MVSLIQAQQWERATKVIQIIEQSDARSRVLLKLGTSFAQVQQWEQAKRAWMEAERVIGELKDGNERARALRELSTALTQAQQWEQTERVIYLIEDNNERIRALRELAAKTAELGKYENLLHLIQNSWWLANTREDALRYFSLATEFILSRPKIGIDFHEAFVWVDNFLRG